MANPLTRFEQRLEQLVSGVFARAFRSAVQPVEIAAALQREVDNNAQILSRDRRLVPNDFDVELSATDLERLTGYDDAMERDLVDQLRDHAEAQGYVFPGPVTIAFHGTEDLTTGRFRIRSRAQASVTGDSSVRPGQQRETRVVVEVNGTRHPLRTSGLVVGRGTEADLRISDPGVSRRHIEFALTGGDGVTVRDLDSTNGMLVNGAKVTSAYVDDGGTVKIGHTTMTIRVLAAGAGRDGDV